MANKIFIIKKKDIESLEEELLQVSGSFKLNGSKMKNGDMIISVPEKYNRLALFERKVKNKSEKFEKKSYKDVLKEKKLEKKADVKTHAN